VLESPLKKFGQIIYWKLVNTQKLHFNFRRDAALSEILHSPLVWQVVVRMRK